PPRRRRATPSASSRGSYRAFRSAPGWTRPITAASATGGSLGRTWTAPPSSGRAAPMRTFTATRGRRWALPRPQHERIALRVLERHVGAPRLLLRLSLDLHAAPLQLLVAPAHVVAGERAVEEGADAVLLAIRREQDDAGLRARDLELDPAPALAEGLVG